MLNVSEQSGRAR